MFAAKFTANLYLTPVRRFAILSFSTMAMACVSYIPNAFAHDSHTSPRHGGIVAEAGKLQFELVIKPTELTLHVSDHGAGVDLKGATAKIILLDAGAKTEVLLVLSGSAFGAKSTSSSFPAKKGVKAVALVTTAGSAPMTVRFEVK